MRGVVIFNGRLVVSRRYNKVDINARTCQQYFTSLMKG